MKGRYGIHGGQYIPETLMSEIHKIEEAYEFYKNEVLSKRGRINEGLKLLGQLEEMDHLYYIMRKR